MAKTKNEQRTSDPHCCEPDKTRARNPETGSMNGAAMASPKDPQRQTPKAPASSRIVEERALGRFCVLQVGLQASAKRKNIRTLVYLPGGFRTDMPVGIVMHGVTRDASSYMESWMGLAEQCGFVLVVPEFSKDSWPSTYSYNLGNVRSRSGKDRKAREWSFSALDDIFEAVRELFALEAERFHVYGHSAGAQFVHRYLLHTGGMRVERAVASNAGWYMLPSDEWAFPYGISDLSIEESTLKAALATPLTILLGEKDDDPKSLDLRLTREAMAQGAHRLARGLNFIEVARSAAVRLDTTFRWHSRIVQRIGHSDRSMAPYACAALFGPRRNSS